MSKQNVYIDWIKYAGGRGLSSNQIRELYYRQKNGEDVTSLLPPKCAPNCPKKVKHTYDTVSRCKGREENDCDRNAFCAWKKERTNKRGITTKAHCASTKKTNRSRYNIMNE